MAFGPPHRIPPAALNAADDDRSSLKDLGTVRYAVERTFALPHPRGRLVDRLECLRELHDVFVPLARDLIRRGV